MSLRVVSKASLLGAALNPRRTRASPVLSTFSGTWRRLTDAGTFGPGAGPFFEYRSVASNVQDAKVLRSEMLHVNGADADCWVVSVEYEPQKDQASSEQTAAFGVKELSRSKTLWIDKTRCLVYQDSNNR